MFVVLLSCTAFAADRWHWVVSNDTFGVFFDTKTISYEKTSYGVDKSIIDVWEKDVYSKDYENPNAPTFDTIDYKHLAYVLYHEKYDLVNKKTITLHVVSYDVNGHSFSTDFQDATWDQVIPDSNGEYMLNVLQNYMKAHDLQ